MNQDMINEMIATRRQIHQRPEEGWTEFETTWLIVNRLKKLGYENILMGAQCLDKNAILGRDPKLIEKEIKRAVAHGVPQEFIDACEGYTGAIAILDTQRPGPVTALRFDIDCVLVQETDDPKHLPNAQGFRSERDGLMHACGHDAHTALGLAVARWVMENKDILTGKIKIIFQPAEEGVRGAYAIVASGALDDVNYVLASHCGGKIKPKEVAVIRGGKLATTKLDIRFTGKPSHAGSDPHEGHSALMSACSASMMMAGIPRHGRGVSRIAIGKMIAGEGRNVTPVHALIQIEVRGQTDEINDYMVENVEHIVKGAALAYQTQYSIEKTGHAVTMTDHPALANLIKDVARTVPGVAGIVDFNIPGGSEDFSWMVKRVTELGGQGAMFRWGCVHHGHHKADFDVQDSEHMPIGFEVFTRTLQKLNGTDC